MTKMLRASFYTQTIRNRSSVIAVKVCKRGSVDQLVESRILEVSLYGGISRLDTRNSR